MQRTRWLVLVLIAEFYRHGRLGAGWLTSGGMACRRTKLVNPRFYHVGVAATELHKLLYITTYIDRRLRRWL